MLFVEMKIKVSHHNDLPFSVTKRVKKVTELVQEHFVCIYVLFTVRRTVQTNQRVQKAIASNACLKCFENLGVWC